MRQTLNSHRHTWLAALTLTAAAALLPVNADAQRGRGGGADIVLFDGAGFSGEAVAIDRGVDKLSDLRFNDRTSSIEVNGGLWEICVDGFFGGRCEVVDRDVSDLRDYGLNNDISSVRPVSGRRDAGYRDDNGYGRGRSDRRGGGYGRGGYDRDEGFRRQEGYVGEYAVVFPRPLQHGRPLEAYKGAADKFCKRQGFPDAVFARAEQGYVTDVLCRKR